MNQEMFNKIRVAFILQGCGHCRILCFFIERINAKLPVDKMIKVIDCTYYQRYGIITDPLIALYSKHFDGYPAVFKGNIKVLGSNTRIESERYLYDLFEEEFVIPEPSGDKFNKDCELQKRGLFKNKVICKN